MYALQFIVPLIGAAIGVWLSSYVKKKGENKALKEDLEELTRLVKRTEKKFTDDTEELKAKLNLANQLEFNLRNEARISLINIYKKINAHYNLLSHNEMMIEDFDNWKEFDRAITNCEKSYDELEDLMSLVELFVPNDEVGDELKSKIGDILMTFIEQRKIFNDFARKFENNIVSHGSDSLLYFSTQEEISNDYDAALRHFGNLIDGQMYTLTNELRSYLQSQSE